MKKIDFDTNKIQTPYYITDERILAQNLAVLGRVANEAGCHILLAQKAFSMFSVYPMIGETLSGTTASGLYEAKLGYEEMGKENHIFSPAYTERDMDEILQLCDHIIFNSFGQWQKFKEKAMAAGKSCGMRINPEYSTQDHAIYDPCAPGSRLGVTRAQFREELLDGLEGLHMHTLCEQNSDDFVTTLQAFEERFGAFLPRMKWVNFGGGHHITRSDYDLELLIRTIKEFKEKYNLEVYLEPGEAVAYHAGYLIATVVDLIENGIQIAILDTSAACHMPDVIEMPYRPQVIDAGEKDEKPFCYRLTGPTCLAGDVIGDYSFDHELTIGSQLIFCDMAIYSMVKNNTFNGMPLPAIARVDKNAQVHLVKQFGYLDFKNRLS
ncbi:MAG: carboxynorspermidine decarboxylase [Lachnospiraceae bacterium]|nr:carboxynorspermidine decarboxylase [Lachnospiraceae bacterium]